MIAGSAGRRETGASVLRPNNGIREKRTMMKKRLTALLLLLSFLLVLWVPALGADELSYGDREEITYKEAVAVLSGDGVISGFEDGTFRPKETLTREQACKILTVILHGRPEGIPAFQDVSASSWSAGYIAYCANNDIVAGVYAAVNGMSERVRPRSL